MSAPPGWHPQPDGRDRWWDGRQWTDHYRDPAVEGATQALPAAGTQGGPGVAHPGGAAYQGTGTGWQPQQQQGMSKGLKGCLIGGVVIALLLAAGAVAAVFFFARTADRVVDEARSAIPSGLPTELPSDFPSDLPTDLPEGQTFEVGVGDGFDIPGGSVEPGWEVADQTVGHAIEGMTISFDDDRDIPAYFSLSFRGTDGEGTVDTLCTAIREDGADSADATCIPMFGDPDTGAPVTVETQF
ncbi:DUF2510 domain-containing protein [Phycicoccus sp. CSK15P-2]|uniref:DUF2510 domain-containing protein n=1 Tax=Phycicoccus sp. CSK15P-2 TaxID=2807627 RepID=UPI00194E25DB|nr:DUF2510 domain-containing protein [Phycicoccus sp. CSK15P-2]MBM6406043.1 DUF2510 domain-containing protein [Phycicoccus sp. CSK15P-2]